MAKKSADTKAGSCLAERQLPEWFAEKTQLSDMMGVAVDLFAILLVEHGVVAMLMFA